MCRESDLEGLVLGRLLGRKGGCGQRQNENGAACSACSEFASHDDAPSTFMSSARSPSLSFSLIVAAVERRLLPLRLSMEFHHCSRRDFLTLHDGARSRCIAIDAFNRDGLAASAPYDPAGDLEIHRERDVILAGIGDFTAKPLPSLPRSKSACFEAASIVKYTAPVCSQRTEIGFRMGSRTPKLKMLLGGVTVHRWVNVGRKVGSSSPGQVIVFLLLSKIRPIRPGRAA